MTGIVCGSYTTNCCECNKQHKFYYKGDVKLLGMSIISCNECNAVYDENDRNVDMILDFNKLNIIHESNCKLETL